MAKSLKIGKYRGLKINPQENVVLHVSDKDGKKFHVRFEWDQWIELMQTLRTPISDLKGD